MITYLLMVMAVATTTAPSSQPAVTPCAAVWFEMGYPPPGVTEMQHLYVGVWSDGTIVWSAGRKEPYMTAKVEPARVEKLLKDLDDMQFFDDAEVNRQRHHLPPDAGSTNVAAKSGWKSQRLRSWQDPPNSDRPRFNAVFVEAEKLIRAIVPEKGEEVQKIDERVYRLGRQPRGGSEVGIPCGPAAED